MPRRPLVSLALAGALLLAPSSVGAEPLPADRAAATELFKQARELMALGHYSEACPKFAESHRLDPGGGTVLNLGLCLEAQGKLATAWTVLNEALSAARRDRRDDRAQIANEHIAAIEPRLSRIVVVVPPEAEVDGLEVMRDGTPVGHAAWGIALPVDPGEHRIEAIAPGRKPWRATLRIGADGETKTVTLTPLELLDATVPSPSGSPPTTRLAVRPVPRGPAGPDRTPAYLLGGVGLAALSVGTVFGVLALRSYDAAEEKCPTHRGCSDQTITLRDRAGTQALVANFCIAGGLLASGAAVYFWLEPPGLPEPSRTGSVRGVTVSGRF